VVVVGFGGLSLPLPVFFGWAYDQWSWWLLLFGVALLANAVVLGLRLQLWWIAAVPPLDRAVGETRKSPHCLFSGSADLRDMFRKDLTLAAEQEGDAEYGRRLRGTFGADGAGST